MATATPKTSIAGFQQQALTALKETQDYTLKVTEAVLDHPVLSAKAIPSPAELVDAAYATTTQALELQRRFVGRLFEATQAP